MKPARWTLVWAAIATPGAAQGFAALTAELAQAATFDDAMTGGDGAKSATFRLYERWRDAATPAELQAAAEHERPMVRAYAIRALVETDAAIDAVALMRARQADTATLTTVTGCVRAAEAVGDIAFVLLRPRLEGEGLQDVADTLILSNSPLYAREWALRNLHLRDGMEQEVRRLARAGDAPAAIALARYRLASDVAILRQHLRRADPFAENAQFLAARIHGDPRLLPDLLALEAAAHERVAQDDPSRLRFWLAAIAAQRNETAARFLLRFLGKACVNDTSRRPALLRTLREVLDEHADCPAYAALRDALQHHR
jgi:hypothetical protein